MIHDKVGPMLHFFSSGKGPPWSFDPALRGLRELYIIIIIIIIIIISG